MNQLLFVAVGRVAPAKSDLVICKRDQPMVGDGHAMGVAAQIFEYMLWTTERRFRVDDPVFSKQRSEPSSEGLRLSEEFQVSLEVELAVTEGLLETGDKLATEDATQHFDGEEEAGARVDPMAVIRR